MSDDDGFDFYGKIEVLVDGLELPEKCLERGKSVCDDVREVDDFKYSFTAFGGFDAVVATSVFMAARRSGCPVPAQVLTDFVVSSPVFEMSDGFTSSNLQGLARKFRGKVFDGFFVVGAEDYIGFYADRLGFPVTQERLESELDVSQVAVRSTYKELVEELAGVDTSYMELGDVELTARSFGFHGGGVEDFALFLVEESDFGCSPRVLAASALYVAGKVI